MITTHLKKGGAMYGVPIVLHRSARLLPKWEKITGLKSSGWQTKYMTTRWGTCNIKTGKLWFNLQLAKKQPKRRLSAVSIQKHALCFKAESGIAKHGKPNCVAGSSKTPRAEGQALLTAPPYRCLLGYLRQ